MTQVAARESFELSPRWLLQDSWGYSIWRTWFRCKAHHTDHWRPGLHGRHRNAKTVSRQGSCLKPCCNLLPVSCFLLCQAYQWIYFQVKTIVKPGCSRDTLKAAISSMISVTHVLTVMSHPLNAELPLYHFNWAWITHCIWVTGGWLLELLCFPVCSFSEGQRVKALQSICQQTSK